MDEQEEQDVKEKEEEEEEEELPETLPHTLQSYQHLEVEEWSVKVTGFAIPVLRWKVVS